MIRVKSLSYRYTGSEKPVLHDLNFTIEKGSIFGLLGPSGAGKSTTQKILMGLLDNYSGEFRYDENGCKPGTDNFYENIGIAFDVPRFYKKMTGRENLQFFSDLYKTPGRDIEELLASVELLEAADQKVMAYSKGMTVRLNLCRALLHSPPILFLDEPTSGLDPALSTKIRHIIRREKEAGKTIFLTTHSMETAAELCDKVAFLVDGSIALCASPESLRRRTGKQEVRILFREKGVKQECILGLKGLHTNQRFIELMQKKEILSIHSIESNLNDVFMEVTGRSLHETDHIY